MTINTDASFNSEYKLGGFAFKIVCDQYRIEKSGKFKDSPNTPEQAEIMAIGNAVYMVLNQEIIPHVELLVINTDCTGAIHRITKKDNHIATKVAEFIAELIEKTGNPKFKFKHVKGHNGTPDARSYVNDWCDKEAKRWMRIAVKQHQKKHE